MTTLLTRSLKNKLIQLLLLVSLPILSRGQTTIVNYDFNTAAAYPASPAATATGITSAATSSELLFATGAGTSTGMGAYAANVSGPALAMNSSSGNTRYFQFSLDGATLPKYSAFKIYLQGYRSNTGATTLTLQYSVNGSSYTSFGTTYAPGNTIFTEGSFDLSGLSGLNAPGSLSFRLLASGASGSGSLRVDNFQVQAVNTVDPLINGISPTTIETGSADFALTVAGSNFKPGAVVSLNGQSLVTTHSSATSLVATVPAAAIATVGSYPVAVTNPGEVASPATTFTVTPALLRWTGGGNSISWFNPANWSTNAVPGTNDDVLLDHRVVTTSYMVSFDQNTAVSVKSLTVNPGVGDSIFVVVPVANMVSPAALTLTNTSAMALAIYARGVVTNESGATAAGSLGIDVAGTGPTVFIYNGGSYRHANTRGNAAVAKNLSGTAGTEQGIFDFRLPANGAASYAISTSGLAYGTLILRNRPGQPSSGYVATASKFTIQGNLLIGPGVTLNATINNGLQVAGDIRSQGVLQFKDTSPVSTTTYLAFNGTKQQVVSGIVLFNAGTGLTINNPAGVVLATPLQLSGPLTLTNGTLTTSATNLLTLTSAASLVGGSSTAFIAGPLARSTAAGALSNLVFPTGSGAFFCPVVLNATAQDATTYLVTQKEGSAADPTNFLAGTPALPTLTRVSRVRSVNIAPVPAANNFSGTVTLSFGADDNVNQPGDASFTIGKNSNGAGWQNIGVSNGGAVVTTAATATTGASGSITSQTFTSFSDFALASTSTDAAINPLPVVLTSFVAHRRGADVALNWATATELRNARFEVQRSLDGQLFTMIAVVAGQGTNAQTHQYTALDPAAPATVLYYRLAQVDTDGHTTFSPVVVLAGTTTAVLYPNPARDRLVVPAPAGTQVRVLDLTGRTLQTVLLPPSGEVSVAGLPAGTYLLRLSEGAQTLRFSKE